MGMIGNFRERSMLINEWWDNQSLTVKERIKKLYEDYLNKIETVTPTIIESPNNNSPLNKNDDVTDGERWLQHLHGEFYKKNTGGKRW